MVTSYRYVSSESPYKIYSFQDKNFFFYYQFVETSATFPITSTISRTQTGGVILIIASSLQFLETHQFYYQ
jgi:hypothetical protein